MTLIKLDCLECKSVQVAHGPICNEVVITGVKPDDLVQNLSKKDLNALIDAIEEHLGVRFTVPPSDACK